MSPGNPLSPLGAIKCAFPQNNLTAKPERFAITTTGEAHESWYLPDGMKRWTAWIDPKIPNVCIFTFKREDDTLANMLVGQLRQHPAVLFAGYRVKHPLEPNFELRIQTVEGEITPHRAVYDAAIELNGICEQLRKNTTREWCLFRASDEGRKLEEEESKAQKDKIDRTHQDIVRRKERQEQMARDIARDRTEQVEIDRQIMKRNEATREEQEELDRMVTDARDRYGGVASKVSQVSSAAVPEQSARFLSPAREPSFTATAPSSPPVGSNAIQRHASPTAFDLGVIHPSRMALLESHQPLQNLAPESNGLNEILSSRMEFTENQQSTPNAELEGSGQDAIDPSRTEFLEGHQFLQNPVLGNDGISAIHPDRMAFFGNQRPPRNPALENDGLNARMAVFKNQESAPNPAPEDNGLNNMEFLEDQQSVPNLAPQDGCQGSGSSEYHTSPTDQQM